MPTLLPNGWLIFSIFVFEDVSHVRLVPHCATDARGTEPAQGPRLRLGFPDACGPRLGQSAMAG